MSPGPEGAPAIEVTEFAPAKINLFLHVGAPGADGYHPIHSLMMFADVGDWLALRPAVANDFQLSGPFGAGLSAGADNLVARARDALFAVSPDPAPKIALALEKRLPIASGLGGGSADAAAALRLLRRALVLNVRDEAVEEIAARLGSDVPACLRGAPVIATGRGDRLAPAPRMPDLNLVLVNSGAPSPTGAVYRAYDRAVHDAGANAPSWPVDPRAAEDVAAFLATCRNDLEAPAVALEPSIGAVLGVLAAQPECLLARMSGSGATCFALCADRPAADTLGRRLSESHPDWWVAPTTLAGATAED